MFFGKPTSGAEEGVEKLMILGSRRSRRGAELKVMSAVEHKRKGFFVDEKKELRGGWSRLATARATGGDTTCSLSTTTSSRTRPGAQVRH